MIKESDGAIQFFQCMNAIRIVIISQKYIFHHNFLTIAHEEDADLSVKKHALFETLCCFRIKRTYLKWVLFVLQRIGVKLLVYYSPGNHLKE